MAYSQQKMLKTIYNDVQTYNIHSINKLELYEHDGLVDIYTGTHLQSKDLTIPQASFIVMGMLIEQMQNMKIKFS